MDILFAIISGYTTGQSLHTPVNEKLLRCRKTGTQMYRDIQNKIFKLSHVFTRNGCLYKLYILFKSFSEYDE